MPQLEFSSSLLCGLSLSMRSIAPDYEHAMLIIRDRYEVETQWVIPVQPEMKDVEQCVVEHIRRSQAITARN